MRQRLGIATALLGEPSTLILDEPANGLDPGGMHWMRRLLRDYADRGGTVLLSSHLLHEIEMIADDLVVIGNGRIVAQGTKSDLLRPLPGVGPTLAGIFVAEIGDVHRFSSPDRLCSWSGLTPRHYESDTVVHRRHITKQGSKLVRWAAIEAIQRQTTNKIRADRARIEARRGKNIAKVAAARKLLTLVYYGLRDGHIRALARDAA